MIRTFKNQGTEDIFNGKDTKDARSTCPQDIWKVAIRKLDILDSALVLQDLLVPPANRLEALKGNREGQYSIRINDRYRICFYWVELGTEIIERGAENVEIVDYH
ncbi:MAG: type II toxin-antitoxin system RelE/ParE family toxin [Prochloraceae cyanobacterium]|nr:type II toxin-antitoxin system RelE/ParE family toxin [Prochloraceae cyanobacterium]